MLYSVVMCLILGAFAKLQSTNLKFVVPVRPHVTARLPLDGFDETYLSFFENLSRKFKFFCGNNNSRTHIGVTLYVYCLSCFGIGI
jgi:hypothetical protein